MSEKQPLSIGNDMANVEQALNDFTPDDFVLFDQAMRRAEHSLAERGIGDEVLAFFLVRYLRIISQYAAKERRRTE